MPTCKDCCCFTLQNKHTDNFGYCMYFDQDASPEEHACSNYEHLNKPNFEKE